MDQKPTSEQGIAVYIRDRKDIVIHLSKPMQLFALPKEQAIKLAEGILEAAEMLPDGGDEE